MSGFLQFQDEVRAGKILRTQYLHFPAHDISKKVI
jgi:hypothetical protein